MRFEFIGGGLALALLLSAPAYGQGGGAMSKPAPGTAVAKPDVKPAAPFDAAVARRVTADDVKKWMDEGVGIRFIDTRSSFTGDKVKGADHVPDARIAEWSKDLAKDTLIVAYCTWGAEHTSAGAVLKLQQSGFTNAYALKGGLSAYKAAQLPTEVQP